MKGRKPTVKQKRIMDAMGFNNDFYLVQKIENRSDGVDVLTIVDRETGAISKIKYNRNRPFDTAIEV